MDNRGKALQQGDCETLANVSFSGEENNQVYFVAAFKLLILNFKYSDINIW